MEPKLNSVSYPESVQIKREQLSQQLSDQQEMLQQILETQQSRIQMETLINFGAAQITMTTSDVHDFQTKAFCEMRGVKGDENAWSGWVHKFRMEATGCFRQVVAIQDWDTINRFPNQTFNKFLHRGAEADD